MTLSSRGWSDLVVKRRHLLKNPLSVSNAKTELYRELTKGTSLEVLVPMLYTLPNTLCFKHRCAKVILWLGRVNTPSAFSNRTGQ